MHACGPRAVIVFFHAFGLRGYLACVHFKKAAAERINRLGYRERNSQLDVAVTIYFVSVCIIHHFIKLSYQR